MRRAEQPGFAADVALVASIELWGYGRVVGALAAGAVPGCKVLFLPFSLVRARAMPALNSL